MAERKVYENPAQLRKERKQLFVDAIRHDRTPKRVPILSHAWTWKAVDAGYNLEEYIYDYDKRFDAVCQHHEKYEMDCLIELGGRNAFPVSDCFGPNTVYSISPDKMHLNVVDAATMDADEYELVLREGYEKYKFERVIAQKYGITDKKELYERFGRAAREYLKMVDYNRRITDQYVNKFGVPGLNKVQVMNSVDTLTTDGMRGLKGTSLDIRRQPDNVQALIEKMHAETWAPLKKVLDSYNPEDDDTFCTSFRMTSLSHTLLNPKQFERFSWPHIKGCVDYLAETGKIGILYVEGTVQHILPYLQQIPEGTIGLLIEKEDPVKLQKQLPNVTIIGGYPSLLLSKGTVQENIDATKRLIDEAGKDGNYIFSTDIMLSYPEDATGENMAAVVETVKEYGKY